VQSRRRLKIGTLLLVGSTLLSAPTSAQVSHSSPIARPVRANSNQKPEGVAARLSAILASGRLEDLPWPNFSDYRSQLGKFIALVVGLPSRTHAGWYLEHYRWLPYDFQQAAIIVNIPEFRLYAFKRVSSGIATGN
jgi:hypothetical protein